MKKELKKGLKKGLLICIIIFVMIIIMYIFSDIWLKMNSLKIEDKKTLIELYKNNVEKGCLDTFLSDNYVIESHTGQAKYAVDNVEEAKLEVETWCPKSRIVKNDLIAETKYYYAINFAYLENKVNKDVLFDDNYVLFKKNIIDFDNSVVNLNALNKDELKELFNMVYYRSYSTYTSCGDIVFVKSAIREDKNKYIYDVYYFYSVDLEWNSRPNELIHYKKSSLSIDKKTGKYDFKYNDLFDNKIVFVKFDGLSIDWTPQ